MSNKNFTVASMPVGNHLVLLSSRVFPLLALLSTIQTQPANAQCGQYMYITKPKIVAAQRVFLFEHFLKDAKKELKDGNPGKAEAYLNEALKIAQELKKADLTLTAYREKGRLYRELKMPEHARQFFAKAYDIFLHSVRETSRNGKISFNDRAYWIEKYSDLLPEYADSLTAPNSNKPAHLKSEKVARLSSEKLAQSVQSLSIRMQLYLAERRADYDEENHRPRRHFPAGTEVDVDWGPWMADAQRKFRARWIPLQHDSEAGRIVANFKVSSDGSISKTRLVTQSPSWTANQAVLKSIETTERIRPLPDGSPAEADIQFTFDTGKDPFEL